MLKNWTIRRATGLGMIAGLAAMVLWPAYAAYPERILVPFLAALLIAAFCGMSILMITCADMILHRRGESLRPVRAFDIIIGLALAVPSLLQLSALGVF